jgi:transcriptional regulator with XRE-family HTH domain
VTEPLVLRQLVSLRQKAGWSQQEVGRRIGTSQSAVSELERGEVSPTLGLLERYADLFGMRVVLTVEEDRG